MDTTEYEVYRDYVDDDVETNTDDEANDKNERRKPKENEQDNLKIMETKKVREKEKNKKGRETVSSFPIGVTNARNTDSMQDPVSMIFDGKDSGLNFFKNFDIDNVFQNGKAKAKEKENGNENENFPSRIICGVELHIGQKRIYHNDDVEDKISYKTTERSLIRAVERNDEKEEEKNTEMDTEKEGEKEIEKDKIKMKEKSRQPVSFPLRLFDVVDEEDPSVISWRDMGTSFRIFDVANFVTNILFRRFKCKYLLQVI